jgi:hypothetical protein
MKKAAGALLAVCFSVALFAQDGQDGQDGQDRLPTREEENDVFSLHFGIYDQTDGDDNAGGNPFIDEEETVYEAIIVVDKQVSERDRMKVRFLGDLVSSASITRETNPMFQALQSNPSGNERGELTVGWTRDFRDYSLGGHGSIGGELSNYVSLGWGLNLGVPLPNANTRLRLDYLGGLDLFEIKLFNGLEPGRDERLTSTLEGGLTHVLTPRTVVDLAANLTHQTGFLATTWHSVFVNGIEISENVPDTRWRRSITSRIKYSLGEDNAVELGYRFYDDSWDIRSHTYELTFSQYLFDRRLLLEPNYRYYDQRGASFYDTSFLRPLEFMSSDPDLGGFDGRSAGLKATFIEPGWWPGRKADISLSFDYYTRSDGIDLWWAIFGYTRRY